MVMTSSVPHRSMWFAPGSAFAATSSPPPCSSESSHCLLQAERKWSQPPSGWRWLVPSPCPTSCRSTRYPKGHRCQALSAPGGPGLIRCWRRDIRFRSLRSSLTREDSKVGSAVDPRRSGRTSDRTNGNCSPLDSNTGSRSRPLTSSSVCLTSDASTRVVERVEVELGPPSTTSSWPWSSKRPRSSPEVDDSDSPRSRGPGR